MIVKALPGARVVFTARRGGVSRPPYATNNLADHVGDAPAAVAENRRRLAGALAGLSFGHGAGSPFGHGAGSPFGHGAGSPDDPAAWVWLRQVHGTRVLATDAPCPAPPEADAAVTARAGLPLVVLSADCAPIALVAPGAVGVVHAGWLGLEQGIIGRAVDALRSVSPGPIRAVLGPCVHPGRYEFGADLLERLVTRLGPTVAARTDRGAPALDIPAAVRLALVHAGVDDLDDVDVCTAASPDHFSHRREGVTGRQALVVVREP